MSVNTLKTNPHSVLSREAIGFDIKVTWLAIAKMYNPLAQDYGGTVTMGFVLLNISTEYGTPATKIAPLLGMEPRSLTRLIKKMEEMDIICRKPDPEDKRSVRIFLTPKGQELKKTARKSVDAFNKRVREKVSPEKLEVFYDVLDCIHETIQEHKFES
jgi:DNA-binding MarR family transcriptional regulator